MLPRPLPSMPRAAASTRSGGRGTSRETAPCPDAMWHQPASAVVHSWARRRSNAVMTRADDTAVDHPRDDRRELAARHRDHHFVQERESVGLPVHPEKGARLAVSGKGDDVRIVEARPDRDRPARRSSARTGHVACDHLLPTQRAQQEALFDAVLTAFIQHAARPRQPSAGLCLLGRFVQQRGGEPERAPRGANLVATLDETLYVHATMLPRSRHLRQSDRRRSPRRSRSSGSSGACLSAAASCM